MTASKMTFFAINAATDFYLQSLLVITKGEYMEDLCAMNARGDTPHPGV